MHFSFSSDTTHTAQGYYMYVDTTVGFIWDDARLDLQQVLQPSSATCSLEFWHHAGDYQFLSVHLIEGDDEIDIWEEDGSHEDDWIRETVVIGRVARPWTLRFLAEKGWTDGSTAIDDIRLLGCQFPPVRNNCTSSQFRCERGACVGQNRVCDFS